MDKPILTRDLIQKTLEAQKWTFAKTMAKIPHEWVYKKTYKGNGVSMPDIAIFIKENGYTEYFYGKPYKYLDLNGYKYWTMDYPLSSTDLVNRSKILNK